MKVKNANGQTGELLTDTDTVTVSFSKEKTVYNRDNIESVSITNESLVFPGLGLLGSLGVVLFAIIIDFGSLVSLENQFINISGLLSTVGTLILISGIIGLIYTGYKTFTAYKYNNGLFIRGVGGTEHKLQVPTESDIEIKSLVR